MALAWNWEQESMRPVHMLSLIHISVSQMFQLLFQLPLDTLLLFYLLGKLVLAGLEPVSYTHLDVYKRQLLIKALCGLERVVSNVNIPNTGMQIGNLPAEAVAVSYTHLAFLGGNGDSHH